MSILNFRKYARVQVEIPIKFYSRGSAEPLPAYLNNLSEEGASLVCPFSIPVATVLEFDVQLTPELKTVHIQSEVLWSRTVKENGQDLIAHGLMFRHVNPEDRERLHVYIGQTMNY
jgi:hypothetical protein